MKERQSRCYAVGPRHVVHDAAVQRIPVNRALRQHRSFRIAGASRREYNQQRRVEFASVGEHRSRHMLQTPIGERAGIGITVAIAK